MFIERSSTRIRTARTLFVLLGAVPCAALCGWAVLRQSAAHREAIERRCELLLGLPVRIARVEHPRPDAVRLRGCVLSSPAGVPVLAVPAVEVESSATEVRVRLDRVDCTPQLARVLAALAREWLRQPARFPRDCVVDVGTCHWSTTPPSAVDPPDAGGVDEAAGGATHVRVECVAGNGSRAVRLFRSDAASPGAAVDEIRMIVKTAPDVAEAGDEDDTPLEVTGAIVRPVPVGILEACAGLDTGSLAMGGEAIASGRIESFGGGARWSGTAAGRIERVDLAAVASQLPYRMTGEATLAVDRLDWNRGRITACDIQMAAARGGVEQRLLDALVSAIGCRPGPAYRSPTGEQLRTFDDAALRLRIGAAGVDLRAAAGRAAALAAVRGMAIVEEPPAAVPLGRVAWLLSPPSALPVPASKVTGWVLGLFSEEILAGEAGGTGAGRLPADQAGRPTRRSDF